MFDKQRSFFLGGGSVGGLTEDALLVFLVDVLRKQGENRFLFVSKSDTLNKRVCRSSRWFGSGLIYYPEKDIKKTVPGFMSEYNRYRSSAIIKIANQKSICCLTTVLASKKPNINKGLKPVGFEIKVGGVVDRDNFKKTVLGLGYGLVDAVFKPGDISIRGDVVDIFPVYEKEPVRVSFSYNDIESISFFNIDSQRTVRTVQTYRFWDVFGKEVVVGQSLVDFVAWSAIVNIEKKRGFYSVVQMGSSEYIDSKTTTLQRKIGSEKDFLSFLVSQPSSKVFLVYTDKNKIKNYKNEGVFSLVGKIDNSFFIKDDQSFFIPFWKNKNRVRGDKTNHKPLLNIDLNKTKKGDLVVHVLHGVGVYSGLKTRGVDGFQKEYIKILYADGGVLYVPLDKIGLVHLYRSLGG